MHDRDYGVIRDYVVEQLVFIFMAITTSEAYEEYPDEWGAADIGDYKFDYHRLYDEEDKLYIYPILYDERVCNEVLIFNITNDKVELIDFSDYAIVHLINEFKKKR